jgi:hypothetical protein
MDMDDDNDHVMNNMYDERFKIIFITACMYRSFRLKNKRPLKNLLMLNKGGCGRLSPGIGDISYVKDLQTEEIVTTKFRCSQFSSYHSKSDGFGWVSFFRRPIFH